jgi:hypothetical protein
MAVRVSAARAHDSIIVGAARLTVCTIALCFCRAEPAIVESWARPAGNCKFPYACALTFIFYFCLQ